MAEGKLPLSFETVGKFVKEQLFYEFSQSKKSLVYILMLAVAAAVFANFSGIFPNRQIAEISFYLLYLLLFTVCLNGFRVMTDFTAQRLGLLTSFMKVLVLGLFSCCGSCKRKCDFDCLLQPCLIFDFSG